MTGMAGDPSDVAATVTRRKFGHKLVSIFAHPKSIPSIFSDFFVSCAQISTPILIRYFRTLSSDN